MIYKQEPLRYGTDIKMDFITTEDGTRSYILTSSFKVKNVESEKWITSTIMMHVTCLYPVQWEMIHDTHNCSPRQGVPQIYTL